MATLRKSLFPSSTTSTEYILLQDVNAPCANRIAPTTRKPTWRDGHHLGVLCCAGTAAIVLAANILLTVIPYGKHDVANGIGVLQQGDCHRTKSLDLWLHLLINVLGTLLLGASNYCMQCLSAPTRSDIDKAHSQKTWMDIGVPSVRNKRQISWSRKLLWCLLALSSVPLHLMYNSTVFSSISYDFPVIYTVTSDFFTGASFNFPDGILPYGYTWGSPDTLRSLQNSTDLRRLENKDCIDTFNADIVSAYNYVLMVATESSMNGSSRRSGGSFILQNHMEDTGLDNPEENTFAAGQGASAWVCGNSISNSGSACYTNNIWTFDLQTNTSNTIFHIDHCMAKPANQHCMLRFSVPILIIVIICNVIKLSCMAVIVWRLDPYPLVTVGDAMASFLNYPDPTTSGHCLAGKDRFRRQSIWAAQALSYNPRGHRWFKSASIPRWLIFTSTCIATIIAAVVLLVIGMQSSTLRPSAMLSFGFGAVEANTLLVIPASGIVSMILIANTPQLVVSFLYFSYNSLYTCMLLSEEWSGYAQERKYLRVTIPKGKQRSTYRLQLPYRYGIPLLAMFGFLHWLVSQSIYLVILEPYNDEGIAIANLNTSALGYSPKALLTTICVGLLVLVVGIGMGFRKYKPGIPLVGSCSAAISAACHPPLGDEVASGKSIMWGSCGDVSGNWGTEIDVSRQDMEGQLKKGQVRVGHCSFTSFVVEDPIIGNMYAGLEEVEEVN